MIGRDSRRAFLGVLGTLAFAGCTGDPGASDATASPLPAETTQEPSAGEPAGPTTPGGSGTESPVDHPADCPEPPDVAGLPDRPDELDRESTTAFVEQYERTLALARNPTFVGFSRFEHVGTESVDSGYVVYFYVVPVGTTATAAGDGSTETTTGGGSTRTADAETTAQTPSPTPERSVSYNVGYYLDDHRLVRDKRPDALTYQFAPYDNFDPRDEGELVVCW